MKAGWFLFAGLGALAAYFLTRKTAKVPQGGVYSGAEQNIHQTENNGIIFSPDQSNGGMAGHSPLPIWNPSAPPPVSVIGTPGGTQGGPSISTFPSPQPTNYVTPDILIAPVSDLSPTFWRADAVPRTI